MTVNLPAIPSGINAPLPEVYKSAKIALEKCTKIDECKEWGDKALALASYAKQANDTALEDMARRIRARAVRKAGELLAAMPKQPGKRTDRNLGGAPTRGSIARDAGMSPEQAKQALRVANVPRDQFETAVEGDEPATVPRRSWTSKTFPTPRFITLSHYQKAARTSLRMSLAYALCITARCTSAGDRQSC